MPEILLLNGTVYRGRVNILHALYQARSMAWKRHFVGHRFCSRIRTATSRIVDENVHLAALKWSELPHCDIVNASGRSMMDWPPEEDTNQLKSSRSGYGQNRLSHPTVTSRIHFLSLANRVASHLNDLSD